MKPVYKEKYPHLFEPMYVGRNRVRFNNRVRVAPIGTGATGGGEDSDGRINTFGIDFWMRFIQGGFSSVALPMEVPIDGKTQVTIEYDENSKPVRVDTVVVST